MISVAKTTSLVPKTEMKIVEEESLDLELPKQIHESDDDDDENVISLEKLKRDTLGLVESGSEAPSSKSI